MKKMTLPLWLSIAMMLACFPVFSQKEGPGKPPKDTTKNRPVTNLVNLSGLTDINNLLPQLTPKSPDVAAMERYGNYPVSLYTGLPTIEIPIYEIKAGSITVPVKLSYHAGGIKVTDVATSVGMGWSLIYGGAITRQVKGLADEINAGLLGKTIAPNVQEDVGASCYNEDVRFAFEQMASNNADIERDIFSVNIPSKSNQFILRDLEDYQWLMPEASKIKFTRSSGGNSSYFQLYDEASNYYLFDQNEVTTNVGTTTWLLSAIWGKNITDIITYEYYPEATFARTHEIYESITVNDNPNGIVPNGILTPVSNYPLPNLVSVNNEVEQRLPKTIYFPNGKIEFVLDSTERLDGFGKALDKIEIYSYKVSTNDYQLIKIFDLVQVYKEREDESPVLFLSEVKLRDNMGVELGKYEIEYRENAPFPAVQSKSKDYWGYPNGSGNTSLIPDQSIPLYLGGTSSPTTIMIGGANREVDYAHMSNWTIYRITYPTGGSTDFEFNANQYFDGTTNRQVGGLRISRILNYNPHRQSSSLPLYNTKVYVYGENEDGNGHLRTNLKLQYESKQKIFDYSPGVPPALNYSYESRRYTSNLTGPLFPNEGSPVTYAYVTEYDDGGWPDSEANGKTIYEFRESDDGQITLVNSSKFFVQSRHWNRGQLARKRVYGADDKLKYEEVNTYEVMNSGTTSDLCGRLVQAQNIYQGARPNNEICYSPSNDFDPNQIYYFEYGNCKLIRSESYNYDDTDDTKYVYKKTETDYNNTTFQVKEIREYNSDGSIDYQKLRYVTDLNNLSASHTGNALALYQMKQNNDVITPVESLSLHKNAGDSEPRVLGGKLTNFQIKTFALRDFIVPDNSHLLEIPASPDVLESSFTPLNVTTGGNITKDSHYALRLDFGNYNSYGQLLDYQLAGGATTAFTYTTTLIGAVFHSFVTSVTQNSGGTPGLTATYTYELPLLGFNQVTAPNGLNTYYEYDTFGRLHLVKDHQNNLLNKYTYQYGDVNNISFIKSDHFWEGTTNPDDESKLRPIIQYFDGLGRPLQKIAASQSPTLKDIVLEDISYDFAGRGYNTLLPTPTSNNSGQFVEEAVSLAREFYYEVDPDTRIVEYDNSSLNRPKKTRPPGANYDELIESKYLVAPVSSIRKYTLTATGAEVSEVSPHDKWDITLFKNVVISGQDRETIDYTDNTGKLIQKDVQDSEESYMSTHYLYDDFGRIKYIIQPESFQTSQSFEEDDDYFKAGVFAYRYDERGRIIEKHIPGGGWTSIVYDKLDREIWSQSAYQAAIGRWSFKKYDALNRLIMSGEKAETRTRPALQTEVNAISSFTYETRNTTNPVYYSLNNGYPIVASGDIYIISYYDSYGFTDDSNVHNPGTTNVGLLTGVRSKNQSSNDWNVSSYLYDEKNRATEVRQAFSTQSTSNYMAFFDYIDYTFEGNISQKETAFQSSTISHAFTNRYFYDPGGRKSQLDYAIGNNFVTPLFTMASYGYDEIGRFIKKTIRPDRTYKKAKDYIERPADGIISTYNAHDLAKKAITISPDFVWDATDNNGTYTAEVNNGIDETGLQVMDFKYHIRGGLLGINLDNENNAKVNSLQNDLFAYKLSYQGMGEFADGNITEQRWAFSPNFIAGENESMSYYSYDKANRLTGSTTYSTINGNYDAHYRLPNISYNKNGNITNLERYGKNGSNFETIDNLTYAYQGNKLLSVGDAISGNEDVGDFRDGNTSGNDYEYWPDGSLKKDLNKGISQIDYDTYLRLPIQITRTDNSWIKFFYDGMGKKIKMTTSDGHETYYYREVILKKNLTSGLLEVYQVNNDEGRNIPDGSGGWRQEYDYHDHLGNVRLSFRDSLAAPVNDVYFPPVITQISNPDPFGVELKGLDFENSTENFYKYQGKEKIKGLDWYDFGARMYDPTIGRWNAVDPLAEMNPELTGYRFAFNNPMRFTDFMGLWEVDAHGNYKTSDREDIERFSIYLQGQSAVDKKAGLRQIDKFLKFEMSGGGDSYELSDGSNLIFEGPTVEGRIENGRWKTLNVEYSGWYPQQGYFEKWGYGSTYSSGALGALEGIITGPEDKWLGNNGKYYPNNWGGNQYTGGRTASMAKTAKVAKNLKMIGKGFLALDVAANLFEADYNGWSNRSFAKLGVAAFIAVVSIGTGGVGGVVLGLALSAAEAHGVFDGFYDQYSTDPRGSVTNENLKK